MTVGTHKTQVFTDSDGSLCVKYHNTIVWRKWPNGVIMLDTGGWRTVTTKARMNQAFNQFGPAYYGVYQKDYAWYVWIRGTDTHLAYDEAACMLSPNGGFYCDYSAAKVLERARNWSAVSQLASEQS